MKQCTKEPVQISDPKKEVKNFTQLSLFNKTTKSHHNWADDNFWNDDDDEDEDEDQDLYQQDKESYNQDVYWYE